MNLDEQARELLALCATVEADDGPAFASLLSRMAARLYCRVGEVGDYLAMATHHAHLERRHHGALPADRSWWIDPRARFWLQEVLVQT